MGSRFSFAVRGLVAMAAFATASCEAASDRTAVTLRVTTDLDCHRTLTVRAQWFPTASPAAMDHPVETVAWVHGGPFSATPFPAEWTLHPRDAGAAGAITIVLDATVDATPGASALSFRRVVRTAFEFGNSRTIDVRLASRCGSLDAMGCSSVGVADCTRSVHCNEQGLTCGDDAVCVAPTASANSSASDGGTRDAAAGEPSHGCVPGFADRDGCPENGCETEGRLFAPVHAYRLVDTRAGQPSVLPTTPVNGVSFRCYTASLPGGAFDDGDLMVGSITASGPPGIVVVSPGCDPPRNVVSTLLNLPGRPSAAGFIVTPRFSVSTSGATDYAIDIVGLMSRRSTRPAAGYYHPLARPVRLLDTPAESNPPRAGDLRRVRVRSISNGAETIPSDAIALRGTLTVANAAQAGNVSIRDPDDGPIGGGWSAPFTVAAANTTDVTIGLGDGTGDVLVRTEGASADLVLDAVGYFSPRSHDENGDGLYYYPLGAPIRLLDTRAPPAWQVVPGPQPPLPCDLPLGDVDYAGEHIPRDARVMLGSAVMINRESTAGWAAFGSDNSSLESRALSANGVGYGSGGVTIPRRADGSFSLVATRRSDAVIDAYGFFAL